MSLTKHDPVPLPLGYEAEWAAAATDDAEDDEHGNDGDDDADELGQAEMEAIRYESVICIGDRTMESEF